MRREGDKKLHILLHTHNSRREHPSTYQRHTQHNNTKDNGFELQEELYELTGQWTVPSVFVNGEHLGGHDDTMRALHSGALEQMLAAASGSSDDSDDSDKPKKKKAKKETFFDGL